MTELVRITRGVWRRPEQAEDVAARAAAVLTAMPPDTVLAGLTAAALHRLWLPDGPGERIDVLLRAGGTAPETHAGTRRPEVRGRRRVVALDEVTTVAGLPVTTLERTWLDLAESLSTPDLVAAGDSALRAGADPTRLATVLARARRRRGVRRARAALPMLDHRSRSRPESHLRYALVSGGLPLPEVNEPVFSATGEWLAEPDLSYRDVRLALEYNGGDHADPRRMRRDITRELDLLQRGGWATLVFGPAEVFRRPDQVVATVRALRAQRLR